VGIVFILLGWLVVLALVGGLLYLVYVTVCALLEPRRTLRRIVSLAEIIADLVVGMFSFGRWGEVFDTIKRNKLRTALTAISVAWGIFVMVALLGMGRGLNQGIRYKFRREAQNAVFVTAGKTSVAYGGYNVGRKLTFDNRDYDRATKVAGPDHITGQFWVRGGRFGGGAMKTQRGVKSNAFEINAVHPDDYYIQQDEMVSGRFLSADDVATKRKSAVIGMVVRDYLFGAEEPLGEWINIGGVPFEVVGVFRHAGGDEQERAIYVPVSTAQLAFNGVDHLGMIAFTVGNASSAEAKAMTKQISDQLAAAHQFSPDDKQAVRVFDNVEGFERFQSFFFTLAAFVVLIGCGTLAAGVVGVSNIMMIAVKERTREIGIRKALGATPLQIVAMITQEAILLTAVAGLLGLAGGVAFLEIIPHVVDTDFIRNPSIDIGVGVAAALGLVFAGALAGSIPARTAARVNPVHTLRDD
jgi:putative ABC transport system permease protein